MQKPICFQRNKRGTSHFWQEITETFVTSSHTDRIENHNPIGISHRTNKSNCRVTNTTIVLDIAYGFLVAGASSINMASVHGKKADRQPGMGTHRFCGEKKVTRSRICWGVQIVFRHEISQKIQVFPTKTDCFRGSKKEL